MKSLNRDLIEIPLRSKISIMQFGEGNFLRAFILDFIQELNNQKLIDEGVAIVQAIPFGRIKELGEQDGLYNLYLEGLADGVETKQRKLIDVINDLINPYTDLDKYLAYASSVDLKTIISNTTEAGIVYEEETLSNDVTPNSYPAKLLLLLKNRYDFFKDQNVNAYALNIVPCELIDYNGDKLKEIMTKLAIFNNYSEDFINWLTNENRYYNTLVDRIVPGYPAATAKELQEELGYLDNSLVKGEVFHLWAIEGPEGLNNDLPFCKTNLDIEFVESIKPYKERKVKILNGAHTAIVPLAYLAGIRSVRESLENDIINTYLTNYLQSEVIPTIDLPKESMDKFANSVIDRFLNPFIYHKLIDISLNSMTKYKTRILPTAIELLEKDIFPKHALTTLAATIVFYRGIDNNGEAIKLTDDQVFLDLYKELWATNNVEEIVKTIVSLKHWETDVLNNEDVINFLIKQVNSILNNGVINTLNEL